MTFFEKLTAATPGGIGVCVGLDPLPDKLPALFQNSPEPLFEFNRAIIEATADYVSAYKPNLAFFERFGASGWLQLEKTVKAVPKGKIVILDAKRGDIGSTSKAYADALFHGLGGDAATVSPYLGSDALTPFLDEPEHGAIVLAVTSNPGGADFQELIADGIPVFKHVIRLCRKLNTKRNVGIVVGATRESLWPEVLSEAIDLPLLIPGVGAQGGDPKFLRKTLQGYQAPALVNSSRAIIFASSGDNFAAAARDAAEALQQELVG